MKAPGKGASYRVECDWNGKHYILFGLSASAGHFTEPEEERDRGGRFFFFFGRNCPGLIPPNTHR